MLRIELCNMHVLGSASTVSTTAASSAKRVACHSILSAINADPDADHEDTILAYSYLGGGVDWQPPWTYPLVSRNMPLYIADRYFALIIFLAEVHIRDDMFVRKQSSKQMEHLDDAGKDGTTLGVDGVLCTVRT